MATTLDGVTTVLMPGTGSDDDYVYRAFAAPLHAAGAVVVAVAPHPAHLVGQFSPDKIKDYIAHTLQVTRGCVIEMILKDTHTCDHHPERFTIWTDIAQELAQNY